MSEQHPSAAMPASGSAERSGEAARIAAEIADAAGGHDPFAAAVRATGMPIVVTDPRRPDNPVVFANDAFCRLSGYKREDVVGRNCRFLQGTDTHPGTVALIRAAVGAARPLEVDIRNYRRDGSAFWNRLHLAPVFDPRGELAYFFANQMDVTLERERLVGLENTNASLMTELAGRLHVQQESEARLRFAAEAGGMGFWELDLRTGELTGSADFKQLMGEDPARAFDAEQWRAAIHPHIHPDDRARVEAAMRQSAAYGTDYEVEYRVLTPAGSIRWVEMRARAVLAADGSAARLAGISLDVTGRRVAELRLELSEASLRLATEAAEVGTWDLDLTTDALTWSDRTKAMFGIPPGAACSMPDFYAGLHPEDREATTAAFAAALDPAIRATYDVEYRTVGREDGAVRWVAAKGRGLFDGDRCVRAVGTAINVTARRKAGARQAFLLELWDQLRSLTLPHEIADAAVRALGRHLGVARVAYARVHDDGATVTLETNYTDGVEPISGTFLLDDFGPGNIARQRAGETVVMQDVALDPANNPQAWAAISARSCISVPLVRGGRLRATFFVNNPRPTVWVAEDVALVEDMASRIWDALERARAEDALRQANEGLERQVAERTATLQANEARMRTVFETSFQLQGLLQPDGVLLDANTASLAVIELQKQDVVGKPLWDTAWFAATPGMPEVVRAAVGAAASGREVRQEISINVPSGLRTYDFSVRPVRDVSGAIVAIVPEAMDITEMRVAEESLRQAQKMEAVGQLTGGIAHDFNNLLTGIMGSLEMMQRRIASGQVAGLERYASAAIGSAQRAGALTQRLLAFARRQPLDPKRVEANRLLSGMDDLLRRTLGPSIGLEMVLAGGLWPTLCDPNQLESAILNLAINARDAMPQGGRLTVETTNASLDDAYVRSQGGDVRAGQYVAVCVTDTGTGMAPEIIAKAFDPFFTTKPTGQGTGLGLSMLYGFVKQSEGHVRIYSELGQGTTFKLYLPRHRGRALADGQPMAEPGTHPAAEVGETVLVVEDDPIVRMLVLETLEELGYAAIEADEGSAALRILQSDARVDLLVTDVGLPGLNGRQVADAARVLRPGLRVLFITGYAHNAAIGNGAELEPGMEIMSKPFALDALAQKLRDLIEDT